MAWDSSRPVPWQRLMREWLVYVAIMAAVFLFLFRDSGLTGALAGLLVSGPLYLLVGYVLAKFGYQRKTIREMRAERTASGVESSEATEGSDRSGGSGRSARPKPPPTKRTSTGHNRPTSKQKRR